MAGTDSMCSQMKHATKQQLVDQPRERQSEPIVLVSSLLREKATSLLGSSRANFFQTHHGSTIHMRIIYITRGVPCVKNRSEFALA